MPVSWIKPLQTIQKNFDRQIAKGAATEEQKKECPGQPHHLYRSWPKGLKKLELVVEAATENIDLKLNIFKQLDSLAPGQRVTGYQYFFYFHHPYCRRYQTRQPGNQGCTS